ncbi:MAG: undecaprenyl-diphosphate phosphatase [Clostridia bacterium]|nr:undecaprenyl-diphosphate phosphatase [Clostridia bacterium]
MWEWIKAFVLGLVEGITEWLPISSTGHMVLVDEFLHLQGTDDFRNMFFVVIQLGAILAVLTLFFRRLNPFAPGKTSPEKKETWLLWCKVAVACVPGVITGFLLEDPIDRLLGSPAVIAAVLILYGIFFIVLERANRKKTFSVESTGQMSFATALGIGLFQVLALVPGTSRSGATILGAMLLGCSRVAAAEFSFFLAIPMMCGASALKLLRFGLHFTSQELAVLLIGTVTAYLISLLCIRFLINYLRKHDFTGFGWYRIALGAVLLLYFLLIR